MLLSKLPQRQTYFHKCDLYVVDLPCFSESNLFLRDFWHQAAHSLSLTCCSSKGHSFYTQQKAYIYKVCPLLSEKYIFGGGLLKSVAAGFYPQFFSSPLFSFCIQSESLNKILLRIFCSLSPNFTESENFTFGINSPGYVGRRGEDAQFMQLHFSSKSLSHLCIPNNKGIRALQLACLSLSFIIFQNCGKQYKMTKKRESTSIFALLFLVIITSPFPFMVHAASAQRQQK